MDEEQLQILWNLHAKDAGFKDISEFKTLMADDSARKVYFDNSNKQLGFKDYNDFDLTLKKKDKTSSQPSSKNSNTPGPASGQTQLSEEQNKVLSKAVIPKTPQQEQFEESQRRSVRDFATGEKENKLIDPISSLSQTIFSGISDQLPKEYYTQRLRMSKGDFTDIYDKRSDLNAFGDNSFTKQLPKGTSIDSFQEWNLKQDGKISGKPLSERAQIFLTQKLGEKGFDELKAKFSVANVKERLQHEKNIDEQNVESGFKLDGVVQDLKEVHGATDFLNFAGNMIGQALYRAPTSIVGGPIGSIIAESSAVYDRQIDMIADKEGISRKEVIKRGLDKPAEGQTLAVLAGALDAASELNIVGMFKKAAAKELTESAVKKFAKGFIRAGAPEAVTEAAQGEIEEYAAAGGAGVEYSPDAWRIATAAVGGLIGGGVLGTGTSAASAPSENKINYPEGILGDSSQEIQDPQSASGIESVPQIQQQEDGKVNQGRKEGRQEDVLAQEASTSPQNVDATSPVVNTSEQPKEDYEVKPVEGTNKGTNFDYTPNQNLSPEQSQVETAVFKELDDNYTAKKAQYEENFGNVLDSDNAREMSDDYVKNPDKYSSAVQKPVSAFLLQLYKDKLKEAPKEGQKNIVEFTGGGPGTGKSTITSQRKSDAQIVYDTNMGTLQISKNQINRALNAGKDVEVNYVYKDPIEAFEKGVLPRTKKTGRVIPITEFVRIHLQSQDVIQKVSEEYNNNDRVTVNVIDNTDNGNKKVASFSDLNTVKYNPDDLISQLNAIAEKAYNNGQLTLTQYEAMTGKKDGGDGGTTIPSSPTEPQNPTGSKKLSVISRTNEDVSKLIKEVFDGTYDPQSNLESGAKTKEFVNKIGGIDSAFAARNLLSGAPKMILYAEYIDSLQSRLDKDPGNITLLRNAMIELAVLAKQRGQEIQIMDYIYENYGALFTYEKQIEKFAANTQDGEVPREIQEQLKDITNRYQELLKEVDRLEKIRQENEDKVSIFNIKESIKREGNYQKQRGQQTIEQAQAKREQLKKDFAKTLKGGALQASVIPGLTAEQLKIVVNIAKTYLDELAGNVDLAIANTKAFLKESGKDLTDEQLQVLRKEIEPVWNFDGLKIPYNLIRNLVAQGFDTIEKLAPKVQEMMQSQHPSITERQVRDIISGYGRIKNPSKESIDSTIRKIKLAGQLKSKLDDVLVGKRPLKSGLQREKGTVKERAEVRAKVRYINQLLKDIPLDEATKENELRTAIDAVLARLKNRQEDLKFAISKGEAIKNNNKEVSDPEIDEQRQITQDVKDIYDAVFKDETAADNADRVIKALNVSIDKMKDRINHVDGELFKAKKDKVSNSDIKDMQERLKRLRDFRNFLLEDSGILEVKRLDSLIESARKTEDRLKESILTGNFSKRAVKDNYIGYNVADDEAELVRQKEILQTADTPEQRKAIQLNIEVLTRKIQSVKDLLKKRGELRGVKNEAVKIQYAQELANRSSEHKNAMMIIETAFSLTRAMKAGFDMSIAWIQLMFPNMYFARKDAVSFAKHLVQGDLKNFKSQTKEHFSQGLKALMSASTHKSKTLEISQHSDYELAKDVGLKVSVGDPKLEANEEALMYASFSKISGLPNRGIGILLEKAGAKNVGEFVKESNIPQSFERSAHAMANVVRLQRFSEMASKLRKEGKTPFANREEFKKIAKYVNDSSGASGLGVFEKMSTIFPYFLFSARLISQAIKYATPYSMFHYYKLGNDSQSFLQRINPFKSSIAQRAFMEDYVYAIGIQYMIMQSVVAIVNAAIGGDDEDKWSIETDPRSSSFMQIRAPGKDGYVTYIEPWGPYRTMLVFMSRMINGNMKRRNGELMKMGEGYAPTRKALAIDFLMNKLAPTPAFVAKAFDLHYKFNEDEGTYTVTDSYNNEYEFDKEVADMALPMYFSTMSEGFKSQDPVTAAGLTAMAFFGLGVNTYDESPKEEE